MIRMGRTGFRSQSTRAGNRSRRFQPREESLGEFLPPLLAKVYLFCLLRLVSLLAGLTNSARAVLRVSLEGIPDSR